MPKIKDLRYKIDKIDEQLLKLINRRAGYAIQIGKEKSKKNNANHFHVPHREREIIKRLKQRNPGPFADRSVEAVFREIFSGTLALEKPLKIAYLGPETTFSHQASLKLFGHSSALTACGGIESIFSQVEKGGCDYGVVPVENSIEGVINLTLDCFLETPVLICDEFKFEISLALMSKADDVKKIKTLYSHPQPFAQCRNWLNQHMPGIEQIATSSTAQAARMALKSKTSAAIAGELAAEVYDLNILETQIQDRPENFTRFLVIGKEKAKKVGRNKTSILFSIKDEAGSLLKNLQLFARNNINLTKIQSRPLKNKPWEYFFFVDFQGHVDDEPVAQVIKKLSKQCLFLKVLGSYPEEGFKL